jgi:hypothetical protein
LEESLLDARRYREGQGEKNGEGEKVKVNHVAVTILAQPFLGRQERLPIRPFRHGLAA